MRSPGSEGEKQGADYILGQLESFGYKAELQPFAIPIYEGISTTLKILSPGSQSFAANPMTYSPSGQIEGELVVVPNLGEPADFPPETSGRIALIERGTIPFGEKVANAQAAGAVGVILYNNRQGNFTATPRGAILVPTVTISDEDGQALRLLAAGGTVRMAMSIESVTSQGESLNVITQAKEAGECQVVVGGHMDSVPAGPGANDNASGTAVALEIARVLAAQGDTEGVCFALFGAEEAGLLGSQHYVSQLSSEERGAMLGVLNFDMLGVGEVWPMVGTESLVSLAVEKAQAIGVDAYAGELPTNVGSDHASFINAGVPGILFNCFCDPNYHTSSDRYEYVQADRLKAAGEIGLAMVEELLGGS